MKTKYLSILVLITLLFTTGCEKDWLDINEDPNQPQELDISRMIPAIAPALGGTITPDLSTMGFLCGVYTHQYVTRQAYDQYNISGSDYPMTFWDTYYSTVLKDTEFSIKQAEKEGNLEYAGIFKIFKAYTFSLMVDVWGDIPFSEALAKEDDIISPNFDDDKDIYTKLFEILDEAIADIENEEAANLSTPGADDIIYGGAMDKWVALANTIKLKLYNQVRNTDMFDAQAVQTLMDGDLMQPGDHFWVPYGTSTNPDDRNDGFVGEYGGSQISTYISPWIYETMEAKNDNYDIIGFTGGDPRVPYYWCRQITDNTTENPPEYLDNNFQSIYFGSNSTRSDYSGRSTITMLGIYPIGGKYDDGSGGELDSESASGDAPLRLLTYADRLFIEAELVNAEGRTSTIGTETEVFEAAVKAAFQLIDDVVAEVEDPGVESVPTLSGSSAESNYVDTLVTQYESAGSEKRLEHIMVQKWISRFGGNTIDNYTDYRRTGYPRMWDPSTMTASPGGDNDWELSEVPVQLTRSYPLSLPWYQQELELNNNAPAQKTIAEYAIFWDE